MRRWVSPLAVILFWETVGRLNWVDPFFLPTPSRIMSAMLEMTLSGELFRHTGISLFRALSGYAIACVLGIGLGIAICRSRMMEDVFDPLVELLRPVSTLGLIP
ncbi:MAG: hypothetical protein MUF26_06350, partial [Syntrophales bacterium]|nr:hypothetical protein [Syntrophales bacterium]